MTRLFCTCSSDGHYGLQGFSGGAWEQAWPSDRFKGQLYPEGRPPPPNVYWVCPLPTLPQKVHPNDLENGHWGLRKEVGADDKPLTLAAFLSEGKPSSVCSGFGDNYPSKMKNTCDFRQAKHGVNQPQSSRLPRMVYGNSLRAAACPVIQSTSRRHD